MSFLKRYQIVSCLYQELFKKAREEVYTAFLENLDEFISISNEYQSLKDLLLGCDIITEDQRKNLKKSLEQKKGLRLISVMAERSFLIPLNEKYEKYDRSIQIKIGKTVQIVQIGSLKISSKNKFLNKMSFGTNECQKYNEQTFFRVADLCKKLNKKIVLLPKLIQLDLIFKQLETFERETEKRKSLAFLPEFRPLTSKPFNKELYLRLIYFSDDLSDLRKMNYPLYDNGVMKKPTFILNKLTESALGELEEQLQKLMKEWRKEMIASLLNEQ